MPEQTWRILREADDEQAIEETLDWFPEGEPMPTEEFIDRLCKDNGGNGDGPDDWDIDSYDSPAARKIIRIARQKRRERDA